MLKQKIILSYFSKIFIQVIQVIATIIVARIAGPTVLGTVAFGLAFVQMFSFLGDLGLNTAHVKIYNTYDIKEDCNTTFAFLKIALFFLFVLVVLSYIFIYTKVLGNTFESKIHYTVIYLSLGVLGLEILNQIPKGMFMANAEQARQDIPFLVRSVMAQISRISVVLLGYGAIAIVFFNLVSIIAIVPIYIIFLIRYYTFGKFDSVLAKKYLKLSVPIVIILVIQTFLATGDKVILQYLTNSETLGYYTAGFKFGNIISTITATISILFFQLFSQAIKEKNYKLICDKVKIYERFLLIFVFPLIVILIANSKDIIITLLGSKYTPTVPIFSIFILTIFIEAYFKIYGNIFGSTGNFYKLSHYYYAQLFIFGIGILVFFVLIKNLENKGLYMGISLLSSHFVQGILKFINIKRFEWFERQLNIKLIVFTIVTSSIFLLCIYLLKFNLLINILFSVLYATIFYFLGYITGIIEKRDTSNILEIVKVNKLKSYIKTELKK